MKPAFVDTGGFCAQLVADDAHHKDATSAFQRVREERRELVTTNAVVFETYTLLRRRARDGKRVALRFLDHLDENFCRVERVTVDDEEQAKALVRAHSDKAYSLCDALSFVVAKRLKIEEAIAYDRHFREYGQLTLL